MPYDVIIRNATVVGAADALPLDMAIADGVVAALGADLTGATHAEIDATGLHLLPGLIDAHVHFNEPGRSEWEGWASGSAALAAGGATCCIEMPLNAHPPTLDGPSFDAKHAAAQAASLVDFALWGGLTPHNLQQMEQLAARGVVGFKAFMSNSGIDDFAHADDLTLYEGMQRAAALGLPVAVHAESDAITSGLTARARAAGKTGWRDYATTRPVVAEGEAIARAIYLAERSGCRLHIVHVSSAHGAELVAAAQARGVDVSWETCPHYLTLTEDDLEQLGAVAKCAPPLRDADNQRALWHWLLRPDGPLIASDHSPAPPTMKQSPDAFAVWGGIAGCQSTLGLLLAEGEHHGLQLAQIAEVTATRVAARFNLPNKGRIAVGCDADLTLIDLGQHWTLAADQLYYRHKLSPYVGRTLRGRVVHTLVRGVAVVAAGELVGAPGQARLIKPGV
jgi:allantoinase